MDWSSAVCSSDLIAIACELHAQGRDRAETVVHRHRSRSGRENGKGAIGVGGVDDAVDVRPVVVTGAVLPDAVTAIDHAIKIRTDGRTAECLIEKDVVNPGRIGWATNNSQQ